MPDDLYDRDVLAWSEHQAALRRRVARGERVIDVDWELVVEETEDAGLSELNSVRSDLRHILVHLQKLYGWPDSTAADHRRTEIAAFQTEAKARFAPSMRQRIDLDAEYRRALRQLRRSRIDGRPARELPDECTLTLDQLLSATADELSAGLVPAP